MGMEGREIRVCRQKEQVAGLLFFNLTCSWDWFIWPWFCYLRYIHPRIVWVVAWFWGNILSLEDKVLEALALGANKFNLGNGNLTINIHPFCGLFHLCVSGDLGWWQKELWVSLGVAVSASSSFCLCCPSAFTLCKQHTQSNFRFHWHWARIIWFRVSD